MKNEYFLSIEEFIERAKALGVDFGKGDPRNRLRYYVKEGLLPHAQRKIFEKKVPVGAYPASVLKTLLEIDKRIKEGKSIQEIKRELEREKKKEEFERVGFEKEVSFFSILKTRLKQISLVTFLSIFFTIFIFLFFYYILKTEFFSNLLAKIPQFAQREKKELLERERKTFSFFLEPFLTINAETIINAPLTIKEDLFVEKRIFAPNLILKKDGFEGTFLLSELTENREYLFPDASGIVCLSNGNCLDILQQVTSPGGSKNKIAKFIGERRIADSSIQDFYEGLAITIDSSGNVGIGTQNPRKKLEVGGSFLVSGESQFFGNLKVDGKIEVTGDVCTDLAGGKCLSQALTKIFGFAGITGSGSANYLAMWTSGNRLTQSLIYQSGNLIGINTMVPNEVLTLNGVLSLAKVTEPQATLGFGKIFVAQNGKLYFKDELGKVYDLTLAGISGEGEKGEIAFWNSTSEILGTDYLFWDQENKIFEIKQNALIKILGEILIPTGAQSGYVLTSDSQGFASWQPPPAGTIPSGNLGYTLWHDGTGWVADDFLYNDGQRIGIGGATSTEAILTVRSSNLAQLLLQKDTSNYLKFSVSTFSSEILASGTLSFNSLSNEIKFFQTSIKKGDKVLRAAIPIFKFPVPIETSTTTFVAITKEISPSQLASLLPPQLEGSQRKFALLLNFADNIPTNNFSSWRIDFSTQSDIDFEFPGQNLLSLEEGIPHLQDNLIGLETDNWVLKTKVPNQNYKLRIFNIFLLVYDQIQ